jgi:Ion transport protein.
VIDVIAREETLLNVVRSVTRNGRSILLTALLALVLVYMFSIIGFLFFQEDFVIETEPIKQVAEGITDGKYSLYRWCNIVIFYSLCFYMLIN